MMVAKATHIDHATIAIGKSEVLLQARERPQWYAAFDPFSVGIPVNVKNANLECATFDKSKCGCKSQQLSKAGRHPLWPFL